MEDLDIARIENDASRIAVAETYENFGPVSHARRIAAITRKAYRDPL
jgi:hypothetical protein